MRVSSRGLLRPQRPALLVIIAVIVGALVALTFPAVASAAGTTTFSATQTIPVPPASTYAGSGGGDGWAIALSSNAVYNVFHHSSQLTVACHLQSDASACWTPETITDTTGAGFATSGHPGLWLDQSTGKLYAYATRADGAGGVVCIDTTIAATNPDPFCGFTALTAADPAALGGGISPLSEPAQIGSKWYAFNYVNGVPVGSAGTGENTLLCFDLSTKAACASQPYAVALGADPLSASTYPEPQVASIGGLIVVAASNSTGGLLSCFDPALGRTCSGSWPISAGAYASSYGAPFPLLSSAGAVTGFCLPDGTDECFGLTGAPVATPAGMPAAIPATSGWNGQAVVLGPRVYVPNGNSNEVDCFDANTGAACANFPKALTNLSLLYTVNRDPARPTCLWVNADNGSGQLQNFDAYTGGACGQGPIRVLASSFVVPTQLCQPASYTSLQVTAPAPGTYASGSVSFQDGDATPMPGLSDKPLDGTGTVSLSGLNLSTSVGLPQFLITLTGAQGTPGAVTVKLIWTGTDDPSCVKPGTTVSGSGGALTYAALGDSYSSGEGNPPFIAGTDTPGTDMCHRSDAAYPELLRADSSLHVSQFSFVACSGDTRSTLWLGRPDDNEGSQFAAISGSTNLITLSLGGNDVLFTDTLKACINAAGFHGSDNCQYDRVRNPATGRMESREQYEQQLINDLSVDSAQFCYTPDGYITCTPSLHGLYEQLAVKSAQGVRIRVLLYPHLFTTSPARNGCTIRSGSAILLQASISRRNILWINQGVNQLDTKILSEVAIARKAGVNIQAVDPRPAFDSTASGASPGGHGVCTAQPWIRGLVLQSNRGYISPYSFHPNATGQQHFETAIRSTI